MKEIIKINKNSFARITALLYGLVGFVMAMIVAVYTIVNIILRQDFLGSAVLVVLFNLGEGILIGVLTALLTALLGWGLGYMMAGIYNWFAAKAGGVKVEVEDMGEKSKKLKSN